MNTGSWLARPRARAEGQTNKAKSGDATEETPDVGKHEKGRERESERGGGWGKTGKIVCLNLKNAKPRGSGVGRSAGEKEKRGNSKSRENRKKEKITSS